MSFSENLRRARKQAGMNQTQLAEAIGSKQNDVSRWEKAEFTPNIEKVVKICQVLHVSADELLETGIK